MESENVLPRGRVISAMFLVAGTCIGGGMLALPVVTGVGGFWPSIFVMSLCWIAMTLTALLLLEVSLWMEEGAHVITMTTRLLGIPGRVVSWCLYLFICYASIVAYTAGGGSQMARAIEYYTNYPISHEWASLIFLIVFGVVVDCGSIVVGRVNAVLFVAMIVSYFVLVGMGVDEVNSEHFLHQRWSQAWWAIPLTLTTFSFQTMVPSLTPYLHKHVSALRWAIVGGTSITMLIYVIWQWLILGIVPAEGEHSLALALQQGESPTQFLREHVEGQWIYIIAEYFAFFAIVTSFLGIALGLFDFLADGLKIKKEGWGKLALGSLIIIPSLIFATQYERAFLTSLETSGGIGDSILNGMIPVLMAWIGRYRMGYVGEFRVPGGKPVLCGLFAFFFCALVVQVLAYTVAK